MAIELDTVVCRVPDLLSTPLDDEIVILNLASDHYVALDDIGRRIWDLVSEPRTVSSLCELLGREFADPEDQIRTDVLAFLNDMADESLLNVIDSKSA